ncbi:MULTISPECIES: MerR family transcriptional regulator [Pseudomonas]|jgi:DNA-binding transcriptional MerR regulator|uniref:MerR family transcriptional regulator n=1 Tax=Pseudomonas extremaustralis TaxID=359110 RepID=A0A5C5QF24_9PSED|nr:MerR family transcriptional regulator [Pseudomonas extremaustralis]MDF3132981.1 MerR family transcriptional regulator [Pseudomonas extremaustralis]TWS03881.1 MerR family transcriptional regulator [Pseudomonas extremaustralis]SDG22052.1 transcriptional regulator, MerR family [Pseudomonas extremaustralis]SKA87396.1 transcriptional regulator, MerR family [Pseudomonas extremaustralis]
MYIGTAARLSGTTVKAIRHYEAIGLLPMPQRQGQYRVYSQQSVERLMLIKCAQQLGFKLKELQEILGDHQGDGLPWERAEQAIASKKRDLSTQIAALQRMQTGLIALETQLKEAQGQCSSMSKIAI